jgi:hypothetical protein
VTVLLAVCSGLVAAARAAGQMDPPAPTYLETGECDQPCWQGIQPGVSTREQFAQRARTVGLFSGRATDYGDGVAAMFELSTWGVLTLADLLRAFGPPDRVSCLGLDHTTMYPGLSLVISVQVYFADGLIVANAVRPDTWPYLSPDMQVRWIRYYAPGEPVYEIGDATPWYGFASVKRYRACHF